MRNLLKNVSSSMQTQLFTRAISSRLGSSYTTGYGRSKRAALLLCRLPHTTNTKPVPLNWKTHDEHYNNRFITNKNYATAHSTCIYWLFAVYFRTYYIAQYFTECILTEIQKENEINILNNKDTQLNNTADTINKHLGPVIRIIYTKTNVSYAKPFLLIWIVVTGYKCKKLSFYNIV